MGSVLHFRKPTLVACRKFGWMGGEAGSQKARRETVVNTGEWDLNWCDHKDGKEGMDVRPISRWNRQRKWLHMLTSIHSFVKVIVKEGIRLNTHGSPVPRHPVCVHSREITPVINYKSRLGSLLRRNGPMDSEQASGWGLHTFPAFLATSHTDSGLQGPTRQYCSLSQPTAPPCLAWNLGGGCRDFFPRVHPREWRRRDVTFRDRSELKSKPHSLDESPHLSEVQFFI